MNPEEQKFWEKVAYNNAERANRYYCLLMDEHQLRMKLVTPWTCDSENCVRLGRPMDSSCECFADKYRAHMRQIAALPGEAE